MSHQHVYMLYDAQNRPIGYQSSFKTLLNVIAEQNRDKIVVLSLLSPYQRAQRVQQSIQLFQPANYDCVQVGRTVLKASKSGTMFVDANGISNWIVYVIDPTTEHIYDEIFHIKNTDEMYVGPEYITFTIRQYDRIDHSRDGIVPKLGDKKCSA